MLPLLRHKVKLVTTKAGQGNPDPPSQSSPPSRF